MMEHERWAKYFETCNTIECFSKLIKIAVLLQRYGSLRQCGTIFSLNATTNLKERYIVLVEPVSNLLKLCTI